MKKGANPTDEKNIAKYYAQGLSAEEISAGLKIELSCVKSFKPKEARAAKKKTKEAKPELDSETSSD